MAATTGPFPDEAETTGGTTCCGGAGHFGVGRSATGALGTALGAGLDRALGTGLGTALGAPDAQAAVAAAIMAIIKNRTRR